MTHNYQSASMPKRTIAYLIDSLLIIAVVSAFLFVRMGKTNAEAFIDEGKPGLADKYPFVATAEAVIFDPQRMVYMESFLKNYTLDALIGLLLLPMLYFVFFEGIWGGTIGKLLLGIRVRRKDGGKINFGISFIRFLGKIVSTIPFFLGFILAFFDKKHQTLHDKIANTLVLNKGTGI
ncbi:MAG: RDD family protein [Bacteroidetes bacterium]|nr:RDD family protein [Bacteroidota bacterium]